MKMFKGFLFVIIGISIVVTLFSLLMPSRVMSVRTVSINSSADSLMGMIQDFRRWREWHPLFQGGIVISDPSFGKGAFAELNQEKSTRFEISETDSFSVRVIIKRKGESPVTNDIVISTFENEPGRQVEWIASSNVKWWPWEKFAGIFFDQVTGPSIEIILNSLKESAEAELTSQVTPNL